MALKFSTAAKNASLETGLASMFNTNGRIAFFSGAQPAGGGDAFTGLLATLSFSADAFATAASGQIVANAISSANATASGTALSFCIYNNGDTAPTSSAGASDERITGTVGTSGADI